MLKQKHNATPMYNLEVKLCMNPIQTEDIFDYLSLVGIYGMAIHFANQTITGRKHVMSDGQVKEGGLNDLNIRKATLDLNECCSEILRLDRLMKGESKGDDEFFGSPHIHYSDGKIAHL